MGKAAKSKRARKEESHEQIPTKAAPNLPLLGLAGIGMLLTAYLTVSAWSGQAVAGCTAGSACDVVLSSRWSRLLGLPISFWGFLAYAALAGIAWIKRPDTHWKLAWTVSLFGVLYSLYLTLVSLVQLQAACPYCLTSLGLMAAIVGMIVYQRSTHIPDFKWRPWLLKTVSGSMVLVLALHLHYAGIWGKRSAPEDPIVQALAGHLADKGAKFYGAFWCPHCTDQKEMFGSSAHRLPYIECSPQGRSGPQAFACQAAGIQSYPTWIIAGQRIEGVLTLRELARLSGFRGLPP